MRSVNFNRIIFLVNSDKPERPVNSSNFVFPVDIHTLDSNKPLRPVNSSNVRPVDVCKRIPSAISNKIVRTVDSKNVGPIDTRKSVFCQF